MQDDGDEEVRRKRSNNNKKKKPGRSAAFGQPVNHSHETRRNSIIMAQTRKRARPMSELSNVPVKRSCQTIKRDPGKKGLDSEEKKPVKLIATRKKVSRRKVILLPRTRETSLLKKVLTRNWIRVEASSWSQGSIKTEDLFRNLSGKKSSSGGVMGIKSSEDLDYSVLREQGKRLISLMKKLEKKKNSSVQEPRTSNPKSEVILASSIADEEGQIPIPIQQIELGCFNNNNNTGEEGLPAKELSAPNEIIIDQVLHSVQNEIPGDNGAVCATHSQEKDVLSCHFHTLYIV